MPITASELRANVYRILDDALATGEAVEVMRKGKRLRIVPEAAPAAAGSRLSRIMRMPRIDLFVGDVEEVIGMDWSKYWTDETGRPMLGRGARRGSGDVGRRVRK